MNTDFFDHGDWRAFLRERFQYLKTVKPQYSARYFARQAGIASPSYFHLVVTGRRTLSPDYAERFAVGLQLDAHQTQCLTTSVALETCRGGKRREQLLKKLDSLRRRGERARKMLPSHVQILSDPVNLKLYLLAQSQVFQLNPSWLLKELPATETAQTVGDRMALLLESGLWVTAGDSVRTIAPTVRTGDQVDGSDLLKMHENLLAAARRSLFEQAANHRVIGSRTFLFDPDKIARVQERIEAFKQEMESEFESLDGTRVYELHLSFFELEPKS